MGKRLVILSYAVLLALAGCGQEDKNVNIQTEEAESGIAPENVSSGKKFESCESIYRKHIKNKALGSLQMVKEMVHQLGAEGYAVVDQYNQVDMENAEQVKAFCQKVAEKQAGNLTLIIMLNDGGFSELELDTERGEVYVTATGWRRQECELVHLDFDTDHYKTAAWVYPDHGYLIFEKYYMPGLSGPYSHVALRVEPLEDTCREYNRTYTWPVGYYRNNMFLCDWDENDTGNLDFCDLFEILYRLEEPEGNLNVTDSDGDIYQIPGKKFEQILMKYFRVDSQTLRKKVTYIADEDIYEFRPRSVYDNAGGASPYPEVIGYEEREDGTVELLVSAVLEERNRGSAFLHKVVIRPLGDGTYQYVSNVVLPSEDNIEPDWYSKRFTEEEWKKEYIQFHGTEGTFGLHLQTGAVK